MKRTGLDTGSSIKLHHTIEYIRKNHIHLKLSEIHSLIILSGSLQTPGRSNKVEQAPNFSTAVPPLSLTYSPLRGGAPTGATKAGNEWK